MNFEIIPDEQTPRLPEILFNQMIDYINLHRTELEEFLKFAETQTTAVGLATNQCSLDGERFDVRAFALRDLFKHTWSLVIDPYIVENVGLKEEKAEGCLTWKGRKILADRYRGVKVDYFTLDGEKIEGELHHGFEGQIWQHEINHLNGVEEVVVDRYHPEPIPVKYGRNEPCPCGSGLKYKKCCLPLM